MIIKATPTEPNWYAVYTRPRTEKKVKERLDDRGFENYLPLKTIKRQWSDRVKKVEVPLITSYVFVKCREIERGDIVRTDGIINFVTNCGKAAVICNEEMERMWRFLADYSRMKLEVIDVKPGQKVEVKVGPLMGLGGKVVYTNENRVSIRLDSLNLQIRAEIEANMLYR